MMAEGMIEGHIENDNDVENDHPNDDDDDNNNDRNTTVSINKKRPMLRFRNYVPLDNELLIKSQQQQGLLFVEDNDNDNTTMNKSSSSNTNKRSKPNPSDSTTQTKSILELAFEKERLLQLQEENEYKTNNNKNHNEQQPMMIENIISNHNHHKMNWDLKRDIRNHLNKLEKRTQKALLDILKHRITLSQLPQHDLD